MAFCGSCVLDSDDLKAMPVGRDGRMVLICRDCRSLSEPGKPDRPRKKSGPKGRRKVVRDVCDTAARVGLQLEDAMRGIGRCK